MHITRSCKLLAGKLLAGWRTSKVSTVNISLNKKPTFRRAARQSTFPFVAAVLTSKDTLHVDGGPISDGSRRPLYRSDRRR